MEKILEGTLNSSHTEDVKSMVVEKIAQAARTTKDADVARKIFNYCSNVIVNSSCALDVSRTRKVISLWTKEHSETAVQFLSDEIEPNLVPGFCLEKRKWLELVTQMLSIIHTSSDKINCGLFLQKLVKFFLQEEDLEINSSLAQSVIKNWDESSVKGTETVLISKIISLLKDFNFHLEDFAVNEAQQMRELVTSKIQQINLISAFFAKIIDIERTYVLFALNSLFKELSSNKSSPNIALASLLQAVPTELSTVAAEILSKDKRLQNKNIQTVFVKLIEWLSWPGNKNLDIWIINFFKHLLIEGGREELVMELIRKNILKIFQHLLIPASRETALPIFSYTLLVNQHSPEFFLQVAPKIPALFSKIKEESKTTSGHLTIKIVAELVYTLMYRFPGYPDVYSSLLQAVKDYPKPSEDNMKIWLSKSHCFGKNQSPTTSKMNNQLNRKSITGKTGLINLGNTCYMNSVIQALFMLDNFRGSLLSLCLTKGKDAVTCSLQKLVAYLLLSERPAISPVDFYKVSRPSWFRQGAQQDCSEFLKYLLDVIEQEDKSRSVHKPAGQQPEELHQLFTGECRVDIECLNCQYVSSRFEAYNDIPLSFPDIAEAGTYCLKGGDISRGIGNTIANAAGSVPPSDSSDVTKASDLSLLESEDPPEDHHGTKDGLEGKTVQRNTDLDTPFHLQGLINTYLSSEHLNGQNKYRCDNCKSLQDAEQRHYFASCPKYLVLTLKRFTYDTKTHTHSKILKNVHYPLNLTIPVQTVSHDKKADEDFEMLDDSDRLLANATCQMNCDRDTASAKSCKTAKLAMVTETTKNYALVAVIVHSGVSSESGHYYCYSRKGPSQLARSSSNPPSASDISISDSPTPCDTQSSSTHSTGAASSLKELEVDNNWYIFNDSNVSYAGENAVQNLHERFPRDTPYVFIYEDISSDVPVSEHSEVNPELLLLVQSDNRQFKEQEQINRTKTDHSLKFDYYKANYRKDDDDDDNSGAGNGSSGNCGGAFPGLSSDANRFIF